MKTWQVYFIYMIPSLAETWKIFTTIVVSIVFSLKADILSEKNLYFGKHEVSKISV